MMRSTANPIFSGLVQAATPNARRRNSVAMLLAWTAAMLCILSTHPWLLGEEPSRDSRIPKFELDIQPILTARGCNSGPCHGKSRGQNGFSLSLLGFDADWDYRAVVEEGRGRRLFPAAPDQSLLLVKGSGLQPHGGGVKLEPYGEDWQTIRRWLEAGMPRTSPDDPTISGLRIEPSPRSMQPEESIELSVIAIYSDGSEREVTPISAYQSNEPAIVSVASDGKIRASVHPGEATIMARFMGRIATWSTAIPQPAPFDPGSLALLQSSPSWIDQMQAEKFRELRLEPSAPANDSQLLRRLSIDLIGRLPSLEEATRWLDDARTAEEKLPEWIDHYLAQPEYADYWANQWADLLRPNPYRVGIKATFWLDAWLREVFRQNLPYDRWVGDLLTAKGSNWKYGAVTVFRDRREPEEITTMVSQLFLGVRLECAKCHQHPFEVYGQKDFYGLASFFSRVGYKGTGLSPPISGGEEMVWVKSEGATKHPLTGESLGPTPLLSEPLQLAEGEDPRAKLMDWLKQPENPYFAQAAVNRIWAQLFGMGLVDPVDDMRATNPPSHPELLAKLADHFRESGYDQKTLLRTLVSSRLYRLSSQPNATNVADRRNYSRHYRQRLRAEVLADSVSDILGRPVNYAGMPTGSRAMQIWTFRSDSELLDAFGRPDPNQDPPCSRESEATVVQALHLMNAPGIQNRFADDQGRCRQLAKSPRSIESIIEELSLRCWSRRPSPEEVAALVADFNASGQDRARWVEDYAWSLLNTPEFLYKD